MKKRLTIILITFLSLTSIAMAEETYPDQSVEPSTLGTTTAMVTSNVLEDSSTSVKKIEEHAHQLAYLKNQFNQLKQDVDFANHRIAFMQLTIYGLAAVLVFWMLLSIVRRRKQEASISEKITKNSEKVVLSPQENEEDTRGEYDFMGSSEGIPAKLDLARAYIAMEDYNAARETLNEILQEGSEQHRQEAKLLLEKI